MKYLIFVENKHLAESIARYLHFVLGYESQYVTLSSLTSTGVAPYLDYDYIITETHNESKVNYGIAFGKIFEAHSKRVIYLSYTDMVIGGTEMSNFPSNWFLLPHQVNTFLEKLKAGVNETNSAVILETLLISPPLTSSHY